MKITHANIKPYLDKLLKEPYFEPGSTTPYEPEAWYNQDCILEVALGEICNDGLKTLAIVGKNLHETARIEKSDKFKANGLEGKIRIRKRLFDALMNLRDLIPKHRGHIVL